jgi:signal transduction histidine kinase
MLKSAPQEVRSQLEQTRILVRESLADARRSIWKLRGAPEQHSSLPDSLSKAALALNQPHGPEVNVQVSGLYRPLDQEREDELLRIAREAISNAVRHANATRVNVELAFAQERVRLSISDDGVGIQPEMLESPPPGHFGLVGLRERAEKIGGKLTITSSGNGTTVQVEAPAVERQTGARA